MLNADRFQRTLSAAAAIACAALLAGQGAPVRAEEKSPYELRDTIDYVMRSDGLFDLTSRRELTIGSEAFIQQLGTAAYTVNEHFYDFEVVSAATIKSDGRRVEVTPDKILVQAGPAAREALYFDADLKVHTVIFPDVAVGDRLDVTVHYRQTKPYLEGGNSFANFFDPSGRRSGVTVSLTAPRDQFLNIDSDGLAHEVESDGDRIRHVWRMGPQAYRPAEAGAVVSFSPRVIVSTFPSWNAVGAAFAGGAAQSAAITPEIRALADEITAGKADRRAQAAAIFDWVATNVRYVAIVLGNGGYVPHGAASVLANRYGDCKDHTTLMKALLAAKGIDAQYALINAASLYDPFSHPMMWFDHVVLYLPEFDVYTDPTAATSAFGVLPQGLAHKPVLRATLDGSLFTRTPGLDAATNRYLIRADIKIAPDGTATGTSSISGWGAGAGVLRVNAQLIAREGEETKLTRDLARQNWTGGGRYLVPSIYDRGEPYTIAAQFTLSNLHFENPDSAPTVPTGPRLFNRPFVFMLAVVREKRQRNFICLPYAYVEEITLRLPEGRRLKSLPKPVAAHHDFATYSASYVLDGSTLTVRRAYAWTRPGAVCSPSDAAAAEPVFAAMGRDVNARLPVVNEIAAPPEPRVTGRDGDGDGEER